MESFSTLESLVFPRAAPGRRGGAAAARLPALVAGCDGATGAGEAAEGGAAGDSQAAAQVGLWAKTLEFNIVHYRTGK